MDGPRGSRVEARTKVGKSRARGRDGPPSAGAGGRVRPAPPRSRCRGVAGPSRLRPPGSPSSAEVPRGAGGAGRAWGRGGAGRWGGTPGRLSAPSRSPSPLCPDLANETVPGLLPVRVPFSDPLPPTPPGPSEAGGETRSFKSRCGPRPRRLRKWRGARTWPVLLPAFPAPRQLCAGPGRTARRRGCAVRGGAAAGRQRPCAGAAAARKPRRAGGRVLEGPPPLFGARGSKARGRSRQDAAQGAGSACTQDL